MKSIGKSMNISKGTVTIWIQQADLKTVNRRMKPSNYWFQRPYDPDQNKYVEVHLPMNVVESWNRSSKTMLLD